MFNFFSRFRIFAFNSDRRLLARLIGRFLRCHLPIFRISTTIYTIFDESSNFAGLKLLQLKRYEVSDIFLKKVCEKILTTEKVMTE